MKNKKSTIKKVNQIKNDLNELAGQIAFDKGFEEGMTKLKAISGGDYYFGFIAAVMFNLQDTLSPKDVKAVIKDCMY